MSDELSTERRLATLEADHAHLQHSVDELVQEVKALRRTLTRGRGFFAGVAAVVVPLWVIASSLIAGAWEKFTS